MGFVVKSLGKAWVRTDNFQLTSEEIGRELASRGLATQRFSVGIIIYPEGNDEFEYFYERHVRHSIRRGEDFVSVLVLDNVAIPSKDQARKALEESLRSAVFSSAVTFNPNVPQVIPGHNLSVCAWSFTENKYITDNRGVFLFRDMQKISSPKQLSSLIGVVSAKDINPVLKFIETTHKPDSQIVIQYIFLVGKYFVAV